MTDGLFLFLLGAALVLGALFLKQRFTAFSAQRRDDYTDLGPVFDMREQLDGRMICEGVIFGPLGRVTSSFTAEFDATWTGDTCVLNEDFTYDDGTTQSRAWELTLDDKGGFTALADDVRGVGQGEVSGRAVLFRYRIVLPEDSGGYTLDAFDCMYSTVGGAVVNRSQFRKFGFKVAELVATIRKVDAQVEKIEPLRRTG